MALKLFGRIAFALLIIFLVRLVYAEFELDRITSILMAVSMGTFAIYYAIKLWVDRNKS